MFLGPISLALAAGPLYDLGGPAYRVLVACVAHVSFLRQKYRACQSCWEVQPATANFCQACGAEIEQVNDGRFFFFADVNAASALILYF